MARGVPPERVGRKRGEDLSKGEERGAPEGAMEEIERSGASVEEALDSALAELGISEQEAEVEVVHEAKGGFLGFKAQPAVVRVRRRTMETGGPEAVEEQGDVAAEFLEGLLEAMGIDADVEISTIEGVMYVDVWGDEGSGEMGILIGKHGNVLDALQELVRVEVHRLVGERCRVVVDVEDYRKRRRSQLVRRAREVARRVKKSGRAEAMEPMTAFDRKIVHDAVSKIPGVDSSSEGEDPNRRVVIRSQ
jgi:spoIIIJ-associated protein